MREEAIKQIEELQQLISAIERAEKIRELLDQSMSFGSQITDLKDKISEVFRSGIMQVAGLEDNGRSEGGYAEQQPEQYAPEQQYNGEQQYGEQSNVVEAFAEAYSVATEPYYQPQ